ncbi:hypothetical protein TIFTF001_002613 [Ficus carica]|uniref:Uncharacterized protein n=1 Tax=Ficus carica TaxID=3494 RepID=A0AA88CU17_FICCA|nr:hypothetical protein TIFTF001_002613 [Ficus carica]
MTHSTPNLHCYRTRCRHRRRRRSRRQTRPVISRWEATAPRSLNSCLKSPLQDKKPPAFRRSSLFSVAARRLRVSVLHPYYRGTAIVAIITAARPLWPSGDRRNFDERNTKIHDHPSFGDFACAGGEARRSDHNDGDE